MPYTFLEAVLASQELMPRHTVTLLTLSQTLERWALRNRAHTRDMIMEQWALGTSFRYAAPPLLDGMGGSQFNPTTRTLEYRHGLPNSFLLFGVKVSEVVGHCHHVFIGASLDSSSDLSMTTFKEYLLQLLDNPVPPSGLKPVLTDMAGHSIDLNTTVSTVWQLSDGPDYRVC